MLKRYLISLTALVVAHGPLNAQDIQGRRNLLGELAQAYEREWRWYTPFLARTAFPCDEIVGRFCLRYGLGGDDPFRVPPVGLREIRRAYVSELEASLSLLPHDTSVSGPLVRVLIESGKSNEAVEAALAFAARDTADAWSYLLLGFALNADGQISAAERAFARATPKMNQRERSRMRDVGPLLAQGERAVFEHLSPSLREDYLARLWRAADPLLLTKGNEARSEHLARYMYVRLLERAPPVHSMPRWGGDLEELTRRFGVPVGTAQYKCSNPVWQGDARIPVGACEEPREIRRVPAGYYHPDQLVYIPPRFTEEPLPPLVEPGTTEWFYGSVPTYHGFLPPTLRAIRPLEHQLSRFPEGDSTVLRADVEFRLDERAPAGSLVEVGLFVLDSALETTSESRDTVRALGKIARGGVETLLPPDAWAYSVEARELGTWQAARARHVLPPGPEGDLVVSDPVLLPAGRDTPVRGKHTFRPFGSLLLESGRELAIYAEAQALEPNVENRVQFRFDLRIAEDARAAAEAPALTWRQERPAEELTHLSVDIGQLSIGPGLYRLILTITDLVSGRSATVEKLFKMR